MSGLAASPTALRQVALAGGSDLDETLDFWRDVLGLETYARFDPPDIAFVMIGNVRLFFAAGTPPATIYLDEPELLAFADAAAAADVALMSPPAVMHVDSAGQFGPAGEAEWMAFLKDPAGNTIGLVARKPA
jgi:catechol 2,3-dioxygenase-like lactoylglutathione lyase family enzyme